MNIEIKDVLDNMSISELQEVLNYCQDRIKLQAESEVEKINQQIAELQARKKSICPTSKNGKENRTYTPVVNPDNPSQIYRGTGPKPMWMKAGGGQ